MRRSHHTPTVVFAALAGLVALLPSRLEARGGWQDIPFTYSYEANAGEDAYSNAFNALGCLDGEWRRSSNSDQWDGSTPEPGDGAPGGIEIAALSGEGDGGGEASVLSLEDVGDPRGVGFPDPGNRKLYLWRDTTAELDLARGVTLVARWRLNPEPRSEEFSTNGGALPVPSGTHLHDQNKGQVGFVQKTAASGTLAATLCFAITDAGTLQFAGAFNNTPCSGFFFPDELCLDVDESVWVSVWMTAQEDAGGIQFRLYLDGEQEPAVDTLLTGIRADAETASLPEAGGAALSYIEIALGATPQDGAIQVDFVSVADGAFDPPDEASPCPGAARSRAEGRNIVLEWTNGAVVPLGVDILRDGVQIATGAPADPPAYTDATAEPGAHTYV
ncbi:MAG: hypothetical protein HY721_14560, partial [Planctomycetes bacterium]|nr:hypothetical protein [Planctomycetota bacterium]